MPHANPAHRDLCTSYLGSRRFLALAAALIFPLTGCQGITGVPPSAQVRIIDASPDAPALDFYQGPMPLAYNLAAGTITSYVPVAAGSSSLLADLSGTHQHLVTAPASLVPGAQYTLLVGNYTDSLHQIILRDQTQPAHAGSIALRFLHQSPRAGPLDLYLVPAGATLLGLRPILANVAFSVNSGYLTLPAGTFTLVALPAGTVPTPNAATRYTGAALTHVSGTVRTIVFIDTTPDQATGPTQAIVANDFDPTAPIG